MAKNKKEKKGEYVEVADELQATPEVDEQVQEEVMEPEKVERVKVEASPSKSHFQRKGRPAGIGAVKIHKPAPEDNELSENDMRLVEVVVDEELHINGQRLYGRVIMPAHQAQSIRPMLAAKKRADIEVHTGKNFLLKKDSQGLHVQELGVEEE